MNIGEILAGPIGGVLKGAADIIGKFKADPDEKQRVHLELAKLQADSIEAAAKAEYKVQALIQSDLDSIRALAKVEAASEDGFVRRARPAWLWALLVIYTISYALIPLISYLVSGAPIVVTLPNEVHLLTGGSFLGYGYLRSRFDKQGQARPKWLDELTLRGGK